MLEALVAGGVLAVGIVGIIGLQARLFHTARFSEDLSNASHLLQHRTEELGSKSLANLVGPPAICAGAAPGCMNSGAFSAAPASGCSVLVREPVPVTTAGPGPGGPYRVDTGIVPHPDAIGHPNSLLATISVCWTEQTGRVRQLQTVRVLGDR
ncbi:hypothetical protein L6R52_03095 [Myxococcota bacterium]|nr:hypothetical protein [Myxococcota bacterium]